MGKKKILLTSGVFLFFGGLLLGQKKRQGPPKPIPVPSVAPPATPSDKAGGGAKAGESGRREKDLNASNVQEKLDTLGFAVFSGQGGNFEDLYRDNSTSTLFLTTDMVWDLYQRALTLFLLRVEKAQAARLAAFSRRLLSLGPGKGGRLWERVFLLCGPALALQDPSALTSFHGWEAAQVKFILGALGKEKPFQVTIFKDWVDPEAFHPGWFYSKDPVLSGYWKALTWYRSLILLSPGKSRGNWLAEEGETAFFLARTILLDRKLRDLFLQMDRTWSEMMGPPLGLDPMCLAKAAERIFRDRWTKIDLSFGWRRLSKFLVGKFPGAFPKESKVLGGAFGVFPRRWTPDSLQLCRDSWPMVPERVFPSGMDWVAIGPLGSKTGRRLFREEFKGEPWVQNVLSVPAVPLWGSIYCENFAVLRRIMEPCHGAPGVFFSPAWRAKQVWTQLGATAALHRNFQLHLVMGPSTGIRDHLPPALSPYPEFYKGVGELLDRFSGFLSHGILGEKFSVEAGRARVDKKRVKETRELINVFRKFGADCRKLAELAGKQWPGPGLSEKEESFLEKFPEKWYGRLQEILPKPLEGLFKGRPSFFLPGWIGPNGYDKTFYYGNRGPFVLWILLPRKGRMVRHVGMVYAYQEGIGPKGLLMRAGQNPPIVLPRFTRKFLVEKK